MRKPSTEQLDTAIAWLRSNEGEEGESERCSAVADWLEAQERDDYAKRVARSAGVPIAEVRKRLRSAKS